MSYEQQDVHDPVQRFHDAVVKLLHESAEATGARVALLRAGFSNGDEIVYNVMQHVVENGAVAYAGFEDSHGVWHAAS